MTSWLCSSWHILKAVVWHEFDAQKSITAVD
jgi:hypothetical protein